MKICLLVALVALATVCHAQSARDIMANIPSAPRFETAEEYLQAIEEKSEKIWKKRNECLSQFAEPTLDFKECWNSKCAEKYAGRVAEKQIKDRRERRIPQETFPGLELKFLQCILSKAYAGDRRAAMREHFKYDL